MHILEICPTTQIRMELKMLFPKKTKFGLNMRAQGKTFPKCSARISGLNGKFRVFHTFPKSVYPTPLLTLKQRPNGAQTPAVFLYFSILNSLPTKKTSSFLSLQGLTDYDAILLEIYKAASCLFCK